MGSGVLEELTDGRQEAVADVRVSLVAGRRRLGTAKVGVVGVAAEAVVAGRAAELGAQLAVDGLVVGQVGQVLAVRARRHEDGLAHGPRSRRAAGHDAPLAAGTLELVARVVALARAAAASVRLVAVVARRSAQRRVAQRTRHRIRCGYNTIHQTKWTIGSS